ncbi:MAG: amino-acid N-acetyltransferase [Treponema sp.]|jgi:amino-acid N-acetyltransferase|nr:amino-acid N-acetyltransferase [Treponema sp.]
MSGALGYQMDLIREAFHYQSRFTGSTMVFKIDFPVTEDPIFPLLMKDIALLAQTGFKVVIVPGAKEWIDSVLAKYGIVSSYAASGRRRITGEDAIPFVEMAAFHVATRFMTALSASRTDSVIGNFVRARGLGVVNGVDMEHTGRVDKILAGPIGKTLDLRVVPILPCIGWGPSGKPYNVPSDEIALAASTALDAVKLFIVSVGKTLAASTDLVFPADTEIGENGRIIRLTPREAESILALNGQKDDPALPGLQLALAASRKGVERVHIIDGREEGAILRELFSNLGAGTMVYADEYEVMRPLKTSDIPDVLRIMEPLMQQGILLRRGPDDIQARKDDYIIFGVDGNVHACGALIPWGDEGEIAAVAVDRAYADRGLGRRIVGCLIDKASKAGFRRVFALTTKTQDWFETLGFRECPPETLPPARSGSYNYERKSKVYALELDNIRKDR